MPCAQMSYYIKSFLLFASLTVAFTCNSLYANDRAITITSTSNPPKIDGRLNDKVWQDGVWFTDLRVLGNPDHLAEVQTEFQITYDDNFLYVAARMHEPAPGKLKIEEFRRNGAVYRDDEFELMIDPYGDRFDYFHFIVNPAGIQYDSKRSYGGEFLDNNWNGDWYSATRIGVSEWTVEMAIPLAELEINPQSRKNWTFNVGRQRRAGAKEELSSFGPMMKNFHNAENFVALYLPDLNLDKFLWNISGPYDYHIEASNGHWIFNGKLNVKNEGSTQKRFNLVFRQLNQKASNILSALNGEVAPGEEKVFEFDFPIEKQNPLDLRIDLLDKENLQDAFLKRRVLIPVNYKPIEIKVLNPAYRNNIYSSQDISSLIVNVRLTLTSKVLNTSTLKLRLFSDKSNEPLSEVIASALRNDQNIHMPISELKPGSYNLEVALLNQDGGLIEKRTEVINKLKPSENEWRVSESGVLLHNGEPFLPLGWFSMLPEELGLSDNVFNALYLSSNEVMQASEALEFLDNVQKTQGYVVMSPYPNSSMATLGVGHNRMLTNEEQLSLKEHVKELKNHPALMAWSIADQPEFKSTLPKYLKQIYNIIKEEDPFHPCIIVNSTVGGIRNYTGVADIFMPLINIPFLKKDGPERPLNSFNYYYDVNEQSDVATRALWAALQASNQKSATKEDTRPPHLIELRNMLYQSIIAGAKGFFWDDFKHFVNYPDIRVGVPHLAAELRAIKTFLLSGTEFESLSLDAQSKNHILFSEKKVGDKWALFVVNTADHGQKVDFKTKLLEGKKNIHVLAENRAINVLGEGSFSDYFEAYAVHVYLSDLSSENQSLQTINSVKDEIQKLKEKRKKLGNLAFASRGLSLSASSNAENSHLDRITDGVFEGLQWISKDNELPQWISLTWESPIKANRVVLYSNSILRAKLQVKVKGHWVDVASFVKKSAAHFEAIFEHTAFSSIRILITAKRPGVPQVGLSEVEVYND